MAARRGLRRRKEGGPHTARLEKLWPRTPNPSLRSNHRTQKRQLGTPRRRKVLNAVNKTLPVAYICIHPFLGAPFKKKPSGVVALTTKDRRAQRRQQKEGYTLTREAKLLWERLRRRDVKGAERETVLSALMAVIKGHIHEVGGASILL